MHLRLFLQNLPPLARPLVLLFLGAAASAQQFCHAQSPDIERKLIQRLDREPQDAAAWRMLGRIRLQRDDVDGAIRACERAVQLTPNSASAHFDFARAWLAAHEHRRAKNHFEKVKAVAPDSDYARQANFYLQDLPTSNERENGRTEPVSFEADLQPNRSSGTPFRLSDNDTNRPFDFQIDIGAIFNSNVQFAPVSRVVSSPGLGGFQGFLSPQMEYRFLAGQLWQAGVDFNGNFNVNEPDLSQFDLQDYQPGAFLQRLFQRDWGDLIFRLQYDFTLDEFAGNTFGTRHAITGLATAHRSAGTSAVYWTIDYSNFADDGTIPSVSSLDGWTNTLGFSHTVYPEISILEQLQGGLDLQWASLKGDDFAYRGVLFYTEGQVPLPWQSQLVLQLGLGYRDYSDFTSTPSRNEVLWRAGVELRKPIGPNWEISALLSFDRFASDNILYDTNRYLTGIVTTYRY